MINRKNLKLLNALQTLKDECYKHACCSECPLHTKGLTANNVLSYNNQCGLMSLCNPSALYLDYQTIYARKGEGEIIANAKD